MTYTMIDVINQVLSATGQRANKTAIAETDSTQYIRDRLNEGLAWIYRYHPTQIDVDNSLLLNPATRTISGPAGLDPYRIYDWSWRINDLAGDIPLQYSTDENIVRNFTNYETAQAAYPQYVYLDDGQIAFYPMLTTGSSALTIQFKYPAQFVKLLLPTDVFPFPDESDEIEFIRKYAQFKYEVFKALGQPGITQQEMEDLRAQLIAKYRKGKRFGFTSSRRYGN